MSHVCLSCGAPLSKRLMRLDDMPARVQNLPTKQTVDSDGTVSLDLMMCERCGLVQFDCPPVDYYRDVIRARGVSKKMHDLHLLQLESLMSSYGLRGKSIWEVGCGGGEILQVAAELPWKVYGIEHSAKLVAEARAKGLDIEQGFVEDGSFRSTYGPYDAFMSINFLEHQPNPRGMLAGIANNLADDGVGLITVPSFDYFLEHATYYELMRDHIANYDVASLSSLVTRCGFGIEDVSSFNEDTISMVVRKRRISPDASFVAEMESARDGLALELQQFAAGLPGGRFAVWGASHQAFTLLSTLGFGVDTVPVIVDSAEFKWGHLSPGSHIPIVSPEEYAGDTSIQGLVIMAPGYSDEISRVARELRPDVSFVATVHGGLLQRLVWEGEACPRS